MRIVADTNTVVSGLLWQGAPRRLIDAARRQAVVLCTSPILLAELARVLDRPKFERRVHDSGLNSLALTQEFGRLAEVLEAPALPQAICRDPDDDHVLACAIAAGADAIVSGDADLLSLGSYRGIAILMAARALERIA